MGKYIRTKNGVYNKNWLEENRFGDNFVQYLDFENGILINPNNIIKEADTIKELCDEFVGIDDGEPQMLRFVPYACAQYWNGGVYGAIWTDKGLIYVAKMNKKGELELL